MTEQASKRALQFGAGNIGRGFIGLLLSRAGYRLTFVDVVEAVIALINQRGKYTIKEIEATGEREVIVEHVKAIHGLAEAEVTEEVSQATIITTAVGPGVLPVIAPVIAKGLQQRADRNLTAPLNIIACENLIDNSKILQKHVLDHLPFEYHLYVESHVGFPRCVVDKVVTTPGDIERERDPLSVIAEGHGLLIVEQQGFAGEPPAIEGMQLTDNLDAYVEQKIFTLNTAHALTAYLGYLKGHEFIRQAVQDPEIRPIISGAMQECGAVLVKRHNLAPAAQEEYTDSVLKRFENSTLPDPIVRVAREPKRKLAPNDRLIKPAILALEAGITPSNLTTGIVAALLYDNPDDKHAVELSNDLKEKGIDKVLDEVCGLASDNTLAGLVKEKMLEVRDLLSY